MTKQIPIVSYGTDAVFTLRLRWSKRKVAVHDGPNVSYQHQPSEPLDMSLVTNVSVTLRREMCRKSVVPPYKIEGQMLRVEFPASLQEVGDWQAHIVCNVVDTTLEDGIMQYSVSVPICSVVRSDQLLSDQPVQHVDVDVWAMLKGAPGDKGEPLRYEDLTEEQIRSLKGDPGDPTELLDELSRQQADRLNEIATAQRESLTSIGARLSDEQRTTLEGLAGRLSREQAGQIAQQTERLSSEQASGLQVISDRLSSEQTQTLERQGQERATAQAEALEALDQEVNRKYDAALEGLSGKVTDEVGRLMPDAVSGRIGGEVQAQLPDVVAQQIPEQVDGRLPSEVESRLPDLVDGRLPDVADRKLPSIVDAKLPPLVDERISGAVEEAMPNQLTTALPSVVASALSPEVERQLPPLVRPAVQPAVEQVMATDLAARVAQGLQIGTRNLIKGSNGRRVLPSSNTNRFNALGYTIIPSRVSTHDSYALSATVEVLSGEANLITAYIYNGHKPVNTVYDMSIGGPQRLTWVFRGNTDAPAVYTSHPLYIYAGVNGNTIGVSIAVSDVILVSGDTPLLSWTPAPEDAYANLCEERLVALSQARAQLWAQYGKIAPNSHLPSDAQSAVRRLWTNYDGAYNRLRTSLQGVVNKPSEQAYTALSSLSEQCQTAASDLQAGMTEAMLSLSPAGQIDYDTLAQSITGSIALDSESRLTIKGQPIGESLKGADGRDGRDGAEVRLDQGWIRPLVVNMRHSPLRGRSNTIPSMDEMQAGVLANPDYLPELWSNSETLYVSFYTNRHRAQHFYWDGLRAYNDGTSGRRVIMRVDISGLQGQHVRLVWTEAQMAKIHELFFNSSGTRSIYVDITDIDDRLHFLTTPGSGGVGGVSMVAIYESLASDNPQLPRGTWAQRPKTPYIGQQYIATDMRRNGVGDLPMWYNGQMWIDYEGHDVTRRYLAEE